MEHDMVVNIRYYRQLLVRIRVGGYCNFVTIPVFNAYIKTSENVLNEF